MFYILTKERKQLLRLCYYFGTYQMKKKLSPFFQKERRKMINQKAIKFFYFLIFGRNCARQCGASSVKHCKSDNYDIFSGSLVFLISRFYLISHLNFPKLIVIEHH